MIWTKSFPSYNLEIKYFASYNSPFDTVKSYIVLDSFISNGTFWDLALVMILKLFIKFIKILIKKTCLNKLFWIKIIVDHPLFYEI